jgi:hypothetical protein
VTRYGHYLGLLIAGDRAVSLPDELGSLIAIHEGHAAVHQDQTEAVRVMLVEGLLHFFQGMLTVVSEHLAALEAQDHQETVYDVATEFIVVHDKDFSNIYKLFVIYRFS